VRPAQAPALAPDTDRQLAYLRMMHRIRAFEERTFDLRMSGEVIGSVHLSNGQEAIPAGTCDQLGPDDAVFATYRGHGWALACGAPLVPMFGELLGREVGLNRGRGGSAYLSAPDVGFYGENSIVGAGAPIAVGAALAGRFDGTHRTAVCVFGDGALNQGAVHEAMNFASAFNLPVIFICENNKYSELTPISEVVRSDDLYRRAQAYPMPGERVDGNDPLAVAAAVDRALKVARAGEGPSLVEAMTQRLVGHYIGDAETYRPSGELEEIRRVEPLVRMSTALLAAGVSQQTIDAVALEVHREVDAAAAEALESPLADASRVLEDIVGTALPQGSGS
jgi:pyruvate dehydrogenase E1 component alpha subunit